MAGLAEKPARVLCGAEVIMVLVKIVTQLNFECQEAMT